MKKLIVTAAAAGILFSTAAAFAAPIPSSVAGISATSGSTAPVEQVKMSKKKKMMMMKKKKMM